MSDEQSGDQQPGTSLSPDGQASRLPPDNETTGAKSPSVHPNAQTPSAGPQTLAAVPSSVPCSTAGQPPFDQYAPQQQQRWPPGSEQQLPLPQQQMLVSPNYTAAAQPFAPQHMAMPSYYGPPPQQLSPGQRPPQQQQYPQMLHPGMMYPPSAYHPQYSPWPGARANGPMPPHVMGPPAQQQQLQVDPSSSRHTPQPPSSSAGQQHVQASPSGAQHDDQQPQDEQRPTSRQQLVPPHLRYPPAMGPPGMHMQQPPYHPMMMGPPHHPQQQHMGPPMAHPGQAFPGHPMYFHPGASPHPGAAPLVQMGPHPGILPGLKPAQREAVEKLVLQLANPKLALSPELVHERRLFFERLVLLNEQQGEILSGPPQVSKSTVDLFSLYHSVKKKGGFEKTIKDKLWKHLCVEANCDMQESSAAGFQLRKHYQKYLLKLECAETGQNAKELIEFAEKQKKKKKEKEPSGGAAGPATPSSSKDEQQRTPAQAPNGPPPPQFVGGYPQGATPSQSAEQQQRYWFGTTPPPYARQPAAALIAVRMGVPPPAECAPGPSISSAWPPPQHRQWPATALQSAYAAVASHYPPQGQPLVHYGYGQFGQYGQYAAQYRALQQQQQLYRHFYPVRMGQYPTAVYPTSKGSASTSSNAALVPQYGYTGPGGDFASAGGYPAPFPSQGQYPSQQWAAFQQQQQMATGMYPPPQQQRPQQSPQMRPPPQFPAAQTEEEQQRQTAGTYPAAQQQHLSASSTPAPAEQQRQTPSRAPSAAADGSQQPDGGQFPLDGKEAVQQHLRQRQAQTPSSTFSANAPTPPLTTYAPPVLPSSSSMTPGAGMATAAYYATPYGRYPPPQSGGPGAELYATGMAGPPSGMYPAPQQAMWQQSPYAQQQRYQQQQMAASRYYAAAAAAQQQQVAQAMPSSSAVPPSSSSSSAVASPQTGKPPKQQQQQTQLAPYAMRAAGTSHQYGQPHLAQSTWHNSASTAHQQPFPSGSLEAQTVAQVQQQTRRRCNKLYARDLCGASPARIVMALRSALHVETVWALNALNVQLYDDTPTQNAAPHLAQFPEMLGLLVDHLLAALSLLFPAHFNAHTLAWKRWRDGTPSGQLAKSSSSSSSLSSDAATNRQLLEVPRRRPIENGSNAAMAQCSNGTQANHVDSNYTMVSRLGRKVKLDVDAEMPASLARELNALMDSSEIGTKIEKEEGHEEMLFPDFVERIRRSTLEHIRTRRALEKHVRVFRRRSTNQDEGAGEFWEVEEQEKNGVVAEEGQKMEAKKNGPHLFFRRPHSLERWGRMQHAHFQNSADDEQHQFSLVARPTVLQDRHADELLAELAERCTALANVLRGYSFLAGQERVLAQHGDLMRTLPSLLMLMVADGDVKGLRREANGTIATDGTTSSRLFAFPRASTPPKQEHSDTALEEAVHSAPQRTMVPAEQDSRRRFLLKVANQLRDDAFVICTQMSAHLDLFEWDSAVSWPMFDALLHWSVSTDLQARDPLPPYGTVPPRHYALEILCKMCVLEHNVDLLLSTGPWPRLEEFVRLLCSLICEEPPVREFAIVILNALCAASEPVCWVAAVETPLLEHLVSFLEAADANMTQIVQQQGMHALRENPEIIGTSVGMLRRTSLIMVQIAKHERCRDQFQHLQHRLLQFTVSHFMDSRVAAMVADILYEIQRGGEQSARREVLAERKEQQQCTEERRGSRSNEENKGSLLLVRTPSAELTPLLNGNGNSDDNNCIGSNSAHSIASSNSSASNENNNCLEGAKSRTKKRTKYSSSPELNHVVAESQNNCHGQWNGHLSPAHQVEVDDPDEKRQKLTTHENVRERMRNSILNKASTKAASPQKKNGWIGSDVTTTLLQNGTSAASAAAGKEHGGAAKQPPASPAANAAGGGGSLTAVA